MNLLAHQLFSNENPQIAVGNFIADAIKGSHYKRFDHEIKTGILLHRRIDDFMDHHPMVLEGIKRIRPISGKFASVVIDIFYDYVLANHFEQFHSLHLEAFTQRQYKILKEHESILEGKPAQMLPYMIQSDWLSNYQHIEGINQSLSGMSRRINHDVQLQDSIEILEKYQLEFQEEALTFLNEIAAKIEPWIEEITSSKF